MQYSRSKHSWRFGAALLGLFLFFLLLLIPSTARAATNRMSNFERRIVETGFQLLPEKHPFVQAYEDTYGVDIKNFKTTVNGVEVSGIPFEFGGLGSIDGFSDKWWQPTGSRQYPLRGLDCTEFVVWVYRQLGYSINDSSAGLFLSGVEGVPRKLPGVRQHLVIPSFEDAMIGDICYNSSNYRYSSGHGSHTQMFLGTANKLGITEALQKYYPGFPGDKYLVLECGFSDGGYYYDAMKKMGVSAARTSMAGVGVQFFTTVKNGGEVLYQSPAEEYIYWEGYHFIVATRLEISNRYLQYRPSATVDYPMNISRPLHRPDVTFQSPEALAATPTPTVTATPTPEPLPTSTPTPAV